MTIELTFSFLLLAIIGCLVLIKPNINGLIKAGLIAITILFSVALYHLPTNFMGYPHEVETLADNSWILKYKIYEPEGYDPGSMVFWAVVIDNEETSGLNIDQFFSYVNSQKPRSYGIPYDKDLHKQLEQARGEGPKNGMLMFSMLKKGMKANSNREQRIADNTPKGKFKVINPVELLPQKTE